MALCGGGGKSPFWHGMLTDLYGIPVHTMQSDEGAALGAAILAGTAAGIYPSVEAGCDAVAKANPPRLPDKKAHDRYLQFYEIYKGLYPALKPTFDALKACE